MKNFKIIIVLSVIALFTSCSSDDDNAPSLDLQSDRNALIEIYNANENSTLNWDITTTDVSTWSGVTVENNRVAVVNISNSYISEVPASAMQKLTALRNFVAAGNTISSIDVSDAVSLKNLQLYDNNLSTIDVSSNILLEQLLVENNDLEDLDVSMLVHLTDLKGGSNDFTDTVNIANGNNSNMWRMELGSSTLSCIQVDEGATNGFSGWSISGNASYSTDCQ